MDGRLTKWWAEHRKLVLAGVLAVVLCTAIMNATDRELLEVVPFIFGAILKPPLGWLTW